MKRFFLTAIVAAMVATTALAQMPAERVVVGASTGWFPGGHIGYTINEKFQLVAQLGLRTKGTADDEIGTTAPGTFVTIGLSGKYFLSQGSDFNTYALGMFYVNPAEQDGLNTGGANEGIVLAGGAEYFPSKNVGLFAQVAVLRFPFATKTDALNFGLLTPSVGIEWFLDLD